MDSLQALRQIFGFAGFRPGQAEAVAAALADRDALVVMPTGSGKSLCYQLPALMRDDLTLVVSPLVSLMADQVAGVSAVAPGRVAALNGQQSGALNASVLERAAAGDLRLLYVAPERFAAPGFTARLASARVGLFVVDEAHCVSHWGHDFRPDYFTLAAAARASGARATMALTATATPQVAGDVARRLALRDPVRVTTGFDRPGLTFSVRRCRSEAAKRRGLAGALATPEALPAIVYAGTRASCTALAGWLSDALGVQVVAYHAGLERSERARVQEAFMAGEAPVIVATNAFGMGVDKANVRTVCHASVPGSLEAYYQEAGRAGRDGQPARCILFAEQRDKGLHVFFIQRARVSEQALAAVAERLLWAGADGRYDLAVSELAPIAGDPEALRALIGYLVRAGVVAVEPAPADRAAGRVVGQWNRRALALCAGFAREAERARWRQYRAIWAYVEGSACRRRVLLEHFGDRSAPAAAGECCDVCSPDTAPVLADVPLQAAESASGMSLDDAIVQVVRTARPPVGRTRAVEILRGGRSKIIGQQRYDALAVYGAFAHLASADVLGRVDELLAAGALRSTGGRFPKLRAA